MVASAGLTGFKGTPPAVKNCEAVCPGTTVGIRRVTPRIPWARPVDAERRATTKIQEAFMKFK